MIVSASRRTDIPALYSGWLRRRMAEGYVRVPHPFRPSRVRTVDLRPRPAGTLDVLVLWTRDPGPVLPDLPGWEARGIRTLWLVTLTGYPRALEPGAPALERVVAALEALSSRVGRERIAWRYDPVIEVPELGMDAAWHARNFARLAGRIAPLVGRCIVSFYDAYTAPERRLKRAGLSAGPPEDRTGIALALSAVARDHGLVLQSCCDDMAAGGIAAGACIDGRLIDRLWGLGVGTARDPGQRPRCRCAPSVDIGVYNTCTHGCLYCYAVRRVRAASARAAGRSLARESLG